jgi:hypothetical protein
MGCRGHRGGPRAARQSIEDPLATKFVPNTWKKYGYFYTNPPIEFNGPDLDCTHPYGWLLSLLRLFEKLWSNILQRQIVQEINRYVLEDMDNNDGSIRGGLQWTHLGLQEFRVYITICLFMEVKRLPSTILYWSRNKPLYHCPIILQLMIRNKYELIARCLYVANAPSHVMNRESATYNKLYKM